MNGSSALFLQKTTWKASKSLTLQLQIVCVCVCVCVDFRPVNDGCECVCFFKERESKRGYAHSFLFVLGWK